MTNLQNILMRSPLDTGAGADFDDNSADVIQDEAWKPSRFNVQTTTDEGWLLLWNSLTGSMNAFEPQKREGALKLIDPNGLVAPRSGITKYMADRGYIVSKNVDELRKIQYSFGQDHYRNDVLELILLVTEDCNFRCSYCYEDFKRGTMSPTVRDGVKKLVESKLHGLKELKISWFGGEPLYGMEAIDDLAPFFKKIAEENDLKFFSHMTTNGYLLTEDVADRLLAWGINDFQITVDGMPEDHNRSRRARDGSDTFRTIFENLISLHNRPDDFEVDLRVNFDQQNAGRLEEFLEMVQGEFRDDDRFTIEFHAVGKWGGANDAQLATCGVDESKQIISKMKKAARLMGLTMSGGKGPGGGVGSEICYAARPYNFIIGSTGKLMKCTIDLDMKDHNVVGKLLPNGELELDVDKMALWTEPAFERDTGCQSCHMVAACQGMHCPKIRIDSGKRPCPSVRQTAKQQMVAHFAETQQKKNEARATSDDDKKLVNAAVM